MDPIFESRLSELAEYFQLIGTTMAASGRSPVSPLEDNLYNAETLHEHFAREDIVQQFSDKVSEAGTQNSVKVLKIQGDMLNALERDMSLRYKEPVRMAAHMAAKAQSYGAGAGPILNSVLRHVAILESMGADDN